MSNVQAPFGFRVAGRRDGAVSTNGDFQMLLSPTDTNVICFGDVVATTASGLVTLATPSVNPIRGILQEVRWNSIAFQRMRISKYWPGVADSYGSANPKALVIDDEDVLMEVQAGNSTAGSAQATQAMVGMNCNFSVGTPNTTTGVSGAYLDLNTVATTSTLPFRILALSSAPDNDNTSAYNRVIVSFNNQDFRQLTGV